MRRKTKACTEAAHHHQIEPEDVLQRVPGVLEPPAPPDHVGRQEQSCIAARVGMLQPRAQLSFCGSSSKNRRC